MANYGSDNETISPNIEAWGKRVYAKCSAGALGIKLGRAST